MVTHTALGSPEAIVTPTRVTRELRAVDDCLSALEIRMLDDSAWASPVAHSQITARSSPSITSDRNLGLDSQFQNDYSEFMARPREFEPDAALEQAVHLFWRKGYEETSYDDIVAATKASRYGLYQVFGSKRDLFRRSLKQYFDAIAGTYQSELRRPGASVREIRGYFEAVLETGEDIFVGRGCLLCNTAIEVAPHDEEIAADIRGFFEDITEAFRLALHNAKSKGEISKDTNIDDWAVALTGLIQSSALMARVRYPVARIHQNVEATLSGLERR